MVQRIVAERYRLDDLIGRGGMATVWRGRDETLGRPVAVKLLADGLLNEPHAVQRFNHEATIAASLRHPNIVTVYDAGVDGETPYLVMELIDGEDLGTVIRREPLPVAEATRVAAQVCAALVVAHAAGVVHRDLKPGNLLVTADGAVKVVDFGIARSTATVTAGLTTTSTVVGTSHYMAPEQVTERSADARTDLYALGCVLYAMLAGHPPFTGQNALAVLYQHQHEPARPLRDLRPDVPAAVEQLVQDLLAKDPDDRPADAVAVAARLRGASSAEVPAPTRKVSAARITVTDTALDVASPRRGRLLAAAAALLAAGLAGYFFAGTGSSDRATATTVDGTASTSPSPTTSAPPITPKATPKAAPKSPPKTTPKAQPAVANNPTAYVIAVISRQHRDGNIASDATADLTARVQRLSGEDGHGNGEVHKVDDIRQRLAAYVSAGKVTTAGSAAIGAALDRLAPHVPKKGKGDD